MPKVDIVINNRTYSVACDAGQEARVRDLAAMMEARVKMLAPSGSATPIGETHLLVLTGLMLADELTEAKSAASAVSAPVPSAANEDLLVAAVDHLTERVAGIAARLDRP